MKVSVVLTTYNRANILPESINSILDQTYKDFELIISDDCSTDNTEVICKKYEKMDQRVHYRKNDKNLGMPGNLNAAILEASGEYIANLHDGDLYDQRLLEKWNTALDKYPKAAFVFNAYRALDSEGNERIIYSEPLPPCFSGHILIEQIFFRRWRFDSPVWGTVMARRSVYEDVHFFNPEFGFISDVDMWLRLAENHHVAYIDEPLISLPDRESVPRQLILNNKMLSRTAENIFWKARMRHYQKKRFRKYVEGTRHFGYVLASRVLSFALHVR